MKLDRSSEIAEHLPYLRRYARAMTGTQESGDNYAAAALEAILNGTGTLDTALTTKVALYHLLYHLPIAPTDSTPAGIADSRLAALTTPSRAALLLHTIEEFSITEVASIIGTDTAQAKKLIETARHELSDNIAGQVLIIEDEALIAMDLKELVSAQGHTVTGIARTHAGAVDLALDERPDLILADIRLADNSSGVEAVNELLEKCGEVPVIFITAYPEILLTGKRPEPAFLITKPYAEDQVLSAVSQAMFFASSDDIRLPETH